MSTTAKGENRTYIYVSEKDQSCTFISDGSAADVTVDTSYKTTSIHRIVFTKTGGRSKRLGEKKDEREEEDDDDDDYEEDEEDEEYSKISKKKVSTRHTVYYSDSDGDSERDEEEWVKQTDSLLSPYRESPEFLVHRLSEEEQEAVRPGFIVVSSFPCVLLKVDEDQVDEYGHYVLLCLGHFAPGQVNYFHRLQVWNGFSILPFGPPEFQNFTIIPRRLESASSSKSKSKLKSKKKK